MKALAEMRLFSLCLGFVGAFLAFIDAGHFASGFTPDGVQIGLGQHSWWWWHLGQMGFALITLAFSLELFQHCLRRGRERNKSGFLSRRWTP